MSSVYSLSHMLSLYNIDIAVITEHRLMSCSKSVLDILDTGYRSVYVEYSSVHTYSTTARVKGGVALQYNYLLYENIT